MQAAGYVRVSSPDQAGEDRFGLADQRHAIEAYAKSQKVEITRCATLCDDQSQTRPSKSSGERPSWRLRNTQTVCANTLRITRC